MENQKSMSDVFVSQEFITSFESVFNDLKEAQRELYKVAEAMKNSKITFGEGFAVQRFKDEQ